MPADPNRVQAVFLAAVELPDVSRAAFLDGECGSDAVLRERVEQLLSAHLEDSFLATPAVALAMPAPTDATATFNSLQATGTFAPNAATGTFGDATHAHASGESSAAAVASGTVIAGRYTLVEVIGEGGMGSVYLASQSEPVKRQVALKLIKAGLDSKTVLARFDAERQALALMDHPNIACIYDGGVTLAGQPFFVMELVKGIPLTEYCDAKRLTVDARLQLFVSVCQAVQHAHQKGIIHRDLKPSNVLVTEVDGRPTPKVIDFGVAKATELKLTDMSFADTGAIVGTPAYMSPEQADPTSMDIDTRTDVYALGVMLYEMLTGSPPIDSKQFKRGAILEMLRMVREVEPLRPSTRLSAANARPNIAANRSIDPAKLAKLLQGELDWVVMKALEKDRTRRYETANGLARDLQRYLADEVVEARPPSRGYRLRKLVRRNKGQVLAACLVLFTLLVGVIGTTLGLLEARRQADIARGEAAEKELARAAEAARAEGERLAKLDAQASKDKAERAATAEQVANAQAQKRLGQVEKSNEILGTIFRDLDPKAEAREGQPLRAQLGERLDAANRAIEGGDVGDPLVVARLQAILGFSQRGLGYPEKAIKLLGRAQKTLTAMLGADHIETLAAMNNLGLAYCDAGKAKLAVPLLNEVLLKLRGRVPPSDPDTMMALNNLALAYQELGHPAKSLPLLEESVKMHQAHFGRRDPATLNVTNNLAMAYRARGEVGRAISILEETLELSKVELGAGHLRTVTTMTNLALAYQDAHSPVDTVPLFEKALEVFTAKLGAEHPDTLTAMNNLALAYFAAGRLDKGFPLEEESLRVHRLKLGPDHPATLNVLNNLAMAYRSAGKLERALPLLKEALRLRRLRLDVDHPDTMVSANNLALAYQDGDRLDLAIPLFEESLRSFRAKLSAEHPFTIQTAGNLATAYAGAQKWTEAADLYKDVLTRQRRGLPPDNPSLAATMSMLGMSLVYAGQPRDAEPLLRECLVIREKTQPDAWSTFNTKSLLGGALLGLKKYDDAEPLLLAGYKGMKAREKTIPPPAKIRLPEALDRLIEFYTATKKPDEMRKWLAERAKYPELAPPPRETK